MFERAAEKPQPTILTGGCNCAAVRFEVTAPLVVAHYCHCRRCQRRTGTAASINARAAPGAVRVLCGRDRLRAWKPDDGREKWFCGDCGSALFSSASGFSDPIGIRMGAFDDDPGIRPSARFFTAFAAPWEAIPADGLPHFTEKRPEPDADRRRALRASFEAALLLLDLDNTLADREGAFLAWAHAKAHEWAPSDPDAVAYLVEQDADGVRARDEFFAALAARFDVQPSIESLIADYRSELRAALAPVREDVIQRLRALRADGWKIAVVTNGEADVQADKVDRLGIAPLLDACCISGALGVRKPEARIFEIAAARCGTPLSNAWMIGDGEADIVGARRAGIHSIWLHRGRTWPRSDVRPDRIADNLLDALAQLTSRP